MSKVYTASTLKALNHVAEHYPNVETFKMDLKTNNLIEKLETVRLKNKSGTNKQTVFVYKVKGVYFIQSYRTIVAAVCCNLYIFPKPMALRFWDSWSRSTSKHVSDAYWDAIKPDVNFGGSIPMPSPNDPLADYDWFMRRLLATAPDFDPHNPNARDYP